jgi:hypothetical protein
MLERSMDRQMAQNLSGFLLHSSLLCLATIALHLTVQPKGFTYVCTPIHRILSGRDEDDRRFLCKPKLVVLLVTYINGCLVAFSYFLDNIAASTP